MPPAQLIILNGASSAGKSSILHALQNSLPDPYLEAGIDKFLWMLPERYLNRPLWYDVIATHHLPDRDLYFTSKPLGDKLIFGMHRAIAALVQAGNNVLVDHVLIERRWLNDCVEQLAGFAPLFVGVRCQLELLERRERDRKDRTLGQARAHEAVVHQHGLYDLEVDTSLNSPEACAAQILAYLDSGVLPTAFARLGEDRSRGNSPAQ